MAISHAIASGMGGMRAAGDLVARMQISRGMKIDAAKAHVADKLGVDVSQLPVVASAPEAVTEKAVAIGTWAVAGGLPTHLGVVPPVLGSAVVTEVLTSTVKELLGGYFLVEPDPHKAAEALLAVIDERRAGLGL